MGQVGGLCMHTTYPYSEDERKGLHALDILFPTAQLFAWNRTLTGIPT